MRAIGSADSGTLFQAAQIRANHLAQGSGLEKDGVETRVAGLLTVSDATYGEKNMPFHGVYGHGKSMIHVIYTDYMLLHIIEIVTLILHLHYMT